MFTMETMVAYGILSVTSLTAFAAIHTAYEQLQNTQQRIIGQQIAWQYVTDAKQVHFRGNRVDTARQGGLDFQVQVMGNSTTNEIYIEVTWHEKTGIERQIELDAFDFIPDSKG